MLNKEQKELVEKHLSYAERLAKKHTFKTDLVDDHTQEAALGFVEAVTTFDPSKGKAFKSYAWKRGLWRVTRASQKHIASSRSISYRSDKFDDYQSYPTNLSLHDSGATEDGIPLQERLASDVDLEKELDLSRRTANMLEALYSVLEELPDKERAIDIIEATVDPDKTMVDVAEKYGVSRQAIAQSRQRLFAQIRKRMSE